MKFDIDWDTVDMTAGELSENERTYIKTSAVIFLLFLYVWVTI
jgi:hypothetical protein